MDLIKDVTIRKLRLLPDDRGFLMELLRSDWPEFRQFGQVYVTGCYPGVIKAWHYHIRQWDNFACVQGMAKVVLFDARQTSPTYRNINEFTIGLLNPLLVTIPPYVFHGFTATGIETAVILNVPTELFHYDQPDEHRVPYDDPSIPYSWQLKHR